MNVLRNWFRFLSSARRSPVPRSRRHQHRRAPQRPQLEVLESRTMPAVSAFLSGTHLIVNGDGSGNTIRVDTVGSGDLRQERISYLAGGSYVEVGQFGGFSDISINSGAGNDVVNINGTINPGAPITINGNSGDDVVNLNSDGFARDTTVLNTSGYTDLHITDPLGQFSTTATVGRSSVTLAHPGGADGTYVIHYTDADLSGLAINLGNAGNTVVVNDTPSNPGRFRACVISSVSSAASRKRRSRGWVLVSISSFMEAKNSAMASVYDSGPTTMASSSCALNACLKRSPSGGSATVT